MLAPSVRASGLHVSIVGTELGKDKDMSATCGHDDMLGYLTNTPCAKCVKVAHAKATGKGK